MGHFARPEGAISTHAEIRRGDVIWHVYRILRPFMCGPTVVVRAPYREGDSIVFDTREPRREYIDRNFASDGNLIDGHSHNDNYWFRTEKEAEAATAWIKTQWESRPDLVAEEMERRAIERELDRMCG